MSRSSSLLPIDLASSVDALAGREPGSAADEPPGRTGAQLVAATRPFGAEVRSRSWWYVGSTFGLIALAVAVAGAAPWWPLRLFAGVIAGLAMTRGFILYHDYMHGAILRRSRAARALFALFGLLFLTPPRSWRASHNYHHANVGKLERSSVGSFWTMTTTAWRAAPFWTRVYYRVVRHPLTILLAYVTVFFWSITLMPLLRQPRKHWDSAVALAAHASVIAAAWWLGGPSMALFTVIVPYTTASALGAYLFYAQHNFPGMRLLPPGEWSMQRASLESCSYLRLGPILSWFTGDIGYHHVHHLNAAIPFYRLGAAMRAIPELQHPVVTSLRPRAIAACLRLKLWDESRREMVGYSAAREA